MSTYVFLGSSAQIWGAADNSTPSIEFDYLGQHVEMEDNFALAKVREDGLMIMPKAEFDALGFTADELKQYPNRLRQHSAPDDFKAKITAANAAFHAYRQTLMEESNANAE